MAEAALSKGWVTLARTDLLCALRRVEEARRMEKSGLAPWLDFDRVLDSALHDTREAAQFLQWAKQAADNEGGV